MRRFEGSWARRTRDALGLLVALAACEPEKDELGRCTEDEQCPAQAVCLDGICVRDADASRSADGGNEGGSDGGATDGAPRDAAGDAAARDAGLEPDAHPPAPDAGADAAPDAGPPPCVEGVAVRTPERPIQIGRAGFFDMAVVGDRVAATAYVHDGRDRVVFGVFGLDGEAIIAPAPVTPREGRVSQVAWNGEGYGVIWADQERNHSLTYRAFTADGIGGSEVRLLTVEDRNEGVRAMSLVWDGDAFVAAYTRLLPTSRIEIMRFNGAGEVLAGPEVVSDPAEVNAPPNLVVAGDGLAVGWMRPADGRRLEPVFARYDRNLRRQGDVVPVGEPTGERTRMSLLAHDGNYLLAWETEAEFVLGIRARALDAEGRAVGEDLRLAVPDNPAGFPRLGVAGGVPGLVWVQNDEEANSHLHFLPLQVSEEGLQAAGDVLPLTERPGNRYEVLVSSAGDDFVLAWVEDHTAWITHGPLLCR